MLVHVTGIMSYTQSMDSFLTLVLAFVFEGLLMSPSRKDILKSY